MESYQIIAQNAPATTALTTLYTVPSSNQCVVSSFVVCNTSSTATTFSLSLAQGGASDTPKQYIYSSMPIAANDTFVATIGVTLAATDVIRCQAAATTLSFTVTGVLIS
jgi:hypothetical protein